MKLTKNILIVLVVIVISIIPMIASAEDGNDRLSNAVSEDYTVIISYDENDAEEILDGLTDEEKDEFLQIKIKEVFDHIAAGEYDKIEQMRRDNPKLTIIINSNGSQGDAYLDRGRSIFRESEIKNINDIAPNAHDTDSFVSYKHIIVSNSTGLYFAEGDVAVTVDRDLIRQRVRIVDMNVFVTRSKGFYSFTPRYYGNDTASLNWTVDDKSGSFGLKAYFNKTVEIVWND